jgi:hypothetical protein
MTESQNSNNVYVHTTFFMPYTAVFFSSVSVVFIERLLLN